MKTALTACYLSVNNCQYTVINYWQAIQSGFISNITILVSMTNAQYFCRLACRYRVEYLKCFFQYWLHEPIANNHNICVYIYIYIYIYILDSIYIYIASKISMHD